MLASQSVRVTLIPSPSRHSAGVDCLTVTVLLAAIRVVATKKPVAGVISRDGSIGVKIFYKFSICFRPKFLQAPDKLQHHFAAYLFAVVRVTGFVTNDFCNDRLRMLGQQLRQYAFLLRRIGSVDENAKQ